MRVVLQRVRRVQVRVNDIEIARIDAGFVALVGIGVGDSETQADALAAKTAGLRLFTDDSGRFHDALHDVQGAVLVVPQFTLLADLRRGRRPSFASAAPPERAEALVDRYAQALRDAGLPVQTGRFGAQMQLELINDGPVTVVLNSADLERPRRGGGRAPQEDDP